MAIKGVTQQVKLSGGDPVDARVDAWLWFYLKRTGSDLSLDSFMAPDMNSIMTFKINFEGRSKFDIDNAKERSLLPKENLDWITNDERQIKWLYPYICDQFGCGIFPVPPRLLGRNLVTVSIDVWETDFTNKSRAVARMEKDWNQHKQSDSIFKWFKEKEEVSRCELAWNWLVDKKYFFIEGQAPISSYKELLIFFDHQRISDSGKKLNVDSIKKRWSQQQYRKKNTGKKQCNFLLSNQSLDKLEKLAVKYDVSKAKVLDALIQFEAEQGVYLPGKVKATSLW
ncbi:MAG: hypothetical protein HHJ09_11165 [Glaciimonas sp.]|nr:hypothetical protein [Glaciimonas sp.]